MRRIAQSEVHKILIINLAFIGDVLLATPVTRALREAYPSAHITMMTVPLTAPIAARNPYINEVIIYDKKGQHRKLFSMLRLIKELRAKKFDLAVCMNFAVRGAMVAWASGIRHRVGYDAQHGKLFLNYVASTRRDKIKHETENHLSVLKPLGIAIDDTSLALKMHDKDKAVIQNKVSTEGKRPLGLLCPIGSYPLKSWPIDYYIEFLKQTSSDIDFYLIGGEKECQILKKIQLRAGLSADRVFAGSLSLPELAAFIQMAKVLVTVDTGPLHMAQAVGTPVIALFGPTDPKVWGPRGKDDIVFYNDLKCSPCWGKTGCNDNQCMKDIDVQQVVDAVRKLLHKSNF